MLIDNLQVRFQLLRDKSGTMSLARCDAAPTLLTNGERSPDFIHRIVDDLKRCLPHAERVVVPATSHTLPGENPQFYGDVVLAFLAQH